jgi:DNA-binding CsgD family transcriptional regulator
MGAEGAFMILDPTLQQLYRDALRGDTAVFAASAFAWLRTQVPFDAGSMVTTHADRPAYLDAHFTGFADLPAMMQSWSGVAHLDPLSPRLLTQPGQAQRQDLDDPAIAGPERAPLRAHLARFAMHSAWCIALPLQERTQLLVLILVRHTPGARGSAQELDWLALQGPLLAETYAACRALALLRQPGQGADPCVARIDAHGAFQQTTPAFAHALWGGSAPQDVHLDPEALRALVAGKPWRLPGRPHTLHATPSGGGWLLSIRTSGLADALSAREREVAQRFASGQNHREVALALGLSPATVRNHLSRVYEKLQVRHRAGLIDALR